MNPYSISDYSPIQWKTERQTKHQCATLAVEIDTIHKEVFNPNAVKVVTDQQGYHVVL
ncbi:hypothetical protein ACT691_03445 [Vibrio metschnikovii]